MYNARLFVAVATLCLLAGGCQSADTIDASDFATPLAPGEMALEPVPPGEIPSFAVDLGDVAALRTAIRRSIAYLDKPSSQRKYPYLGITHARARQSLVELDRLLASDPAPARLDVEIRRRFDVYRSKGRRGTGEVLFTSYCTPIYRASLQPHGPYRHPLYRRPSDLVSDADGTARGRRRGDGSLVPYYTRAQIDAGALSGRGLELVWLADPLDAFLIHVQGSAILQLEDGSYDEVGYAGKTDRPYRSLGAALVRDGHIPAAEISLQAIRQFFELHPSVLPQYLAENESYVFFTETVGGPYGSIGQAVTPLRTIATDKSVYPPGCAAFVDTTLPRRLSNGRVGEVPFRQLVLDQDTGGAIRSAGRCDIYLGTGPEAEFLAGHTKQVGRLYYLFLKEPALSVAGRREAAR